jgi:hypothetical protein
MRTRSARRTVQTFDHLEPRAMLSAPTVSYVSSVTNATGLFVVVNYHADQGLDMSTLGAGDLQLSSAGRPTLSANLFGTPNVMLNGDVQAMYFFTAYGGGWNYTHNGNYITTAPAGQVKDLQGNSVATTTVASNYLWFSTPKVEFVSSTMEATDWLVVLKYTDDTSMNLATLNNTDLSVVGPGVVSGITLQQTIPSDPAHPTASPSITAIYKIPARDGAWNYTHTGTYTVNLNNNEVSDNANNFMPALMVGSFSLWFANPAPQVQSTTVRANDWLIPIKYSALAPATIDGSSLHSDDVTVTASNGFSEDATAVNTINNNDGTYTVVYQVIARGGSWDYSDNATYSLNIRANRIHDTQNRFIAGSTVASFNLYFNNPAAVMVLPTSPTVSQWDIGVKFSDNGTLDTSSITAQSIRVVVPGNPSVTLTLVGTAAGDNGSTIATFRLTPTSGTLPNGQYLVYANPNQTHDTQGSFVNENLLGSFYLWFQ